MSLDGANAGPTILVVDDDVDTLRILTHMLSNAGYNVVQAGGGEEALRKVKQRRPDIILTDLAMPGVTGVEVIHEVKGNPATNDIPCIAVTAHIWDSMARVADSIGCDGFVFKPFNNRELIKELRKHLKEQSAVA
ncbi:MAG: response regulator [Deltaproteobacteria bacterium]|nr:response regulator [Deltaproteobacteria bacterium]